MKKNKKLNKLKKHLIVKLIVMNSMMVKCCMYLQSTVRIQENYHLSYCVPAQGVIIAK